MQKRITIYSIEYWENRGFSKENAILQVNKVKKETSCWCKEFWIKKGLTEEEAIKKVEEKQSNNTKKRSKESYENMIMPWEELYWVNKGFTRNEAKIKSREKRDELSINSLPDEKKTNILNKRKETYYSKSKTERNKINKSRGRTKEQLMKEYGEERVSEISENRGKGRRNSFFRRYSKSSEIFFNELKSKTNKDILFAKDEVWIRYNSNKGFYVDCVLDKKLIEYNGDFYHANPKIYEADSIITIAKKNIKTAKQIWEKDKFKIKKLKELGYEILIIWEGDIHNNKEEILNKCINFLNNE